MTQHDDVNGSNGALRMELYKHLKGESSIFIQEIPKVWLQKFVLIGGILFFILTNQDIPEVGSSLIAFGVVAIPVLALLLDAKILEFGLHSRLISRFLSDTFQDDAAVKGWEELLWGLKGPRPDLWIARIRSFTTVIVAVVPTCVIIILCSAILDRAYPMKTPVYVIVGGSICLVYLLFSAYIWRLVWPKGTGVEPHKSDHRSTKVSSDLSQSDAVLPGS